jgi:hypothetical protein
VIAGGLHEEENLVYACKPCNLKKGTKTWEPVDLKTHLIEVCQVILDSPGNMNNVKMTMFHRSLKNGKPNATIVQAWLDERS